MTTYNVSERFKSVQGEGTYAGTPMAFIRFVGCSVSKKVCHACDTDWEKVHPWRGGGSFNADELLSWAYPFKHVCLTGGEPFDQDLLSFLCMASKERTFHIETSGTIRPDWLTDDHQVEQDSTWICVSPKPGYLPEMIDLADEVKVIVPGLGSGPGWPTLSDAVKWAAEEKTVFLQPRNSKEKIDPANLALCEELVLQHPNLRLSVQLHKLLECR